MNVKRAAKLMQIASYYGEEKQVCKLMEELGEATSAASEVLMLLSYHEQGGKKRDLTARLEHLAGELADVVNGGYLGGGVNLGAFRQTEKDVSVVR